MRKICVVLLAASVIALCAAQSPAADEAAQSPATEATVQKGKKIALEYTLTVDGQVIDSSVGKEPLEFTQGDGKLIPGLTRQLEGMRAGESKAILVAPEEAYGQINPAATQEVPLSALPAEPKPQVGSTIQANGPGGQVVMMRIAQINKDIVVMDLNHPLAGKTLSFQVKIISIQ